METQTPECRCLIRLEHKILSQQMGLRQGNNLTGLLASLADSMLLINACFDRRCKTAATQASHRYCAQYASLCGKVPIAVHKCSQICRAKGSPIVHRR